MLPEVRFWIRDAQNDICNISNDVRLEIRDLFREHGVTIPPPQYGIHINHLSPLMVNLGGSLLLQPAPVWRFNPVLCILTRD
jgi:small-conductance mechanosensitive channel